MTCTFILLCQGVYLGFSEHYITRRGQRESRGTDKPPCQFNTDQKCKFDCVPSSQSIFGIICLIERDTCIKNDLLISK